MSNPSLLNVPYRFKASKLYSQIPDDGLGDFTVTRSASNVATRINAQGFIETVADNVPRLDYPLGGIANGCPALLVEPSAQNLCLQSEALNTSPWTAPNATITPNAILSPANTLTADQINYTAATASRANQVTAVSNSTTYTYSVFIKNNTFLTGELVLLRFENNLAAPNNFEIRATIDPTNIGAAIFSLIGTAGTGTSGTVSGSVQDYGNGWWRVRVTGTTGTAPATATANIRIQQSSSVIARSIYAWGAQLEVGSVATSYIPTTTAAITRGADLVSKTGVSSLIGQTEGTIYVEVVLKKNTTGALVSINDGTGSNRLFIQFFSATQLLADIRVGGLNNNYAATIPAISASGGTFKVALAYKQNDFCFALNGTTYASTASRSVPATTQVDLANHLGSVQLNDNIRAVALYTTRLTNAQLAALTT